MSTSKININSIPNPDVREIVQIIDTVAIKLNLDYYLIGARARDFWFEAIDITPHRFTLDIDFAILVPDNNKFEEVKTLLINEYGFQRVDAVPHRIIYYKNDLIVDLLPFGDIAKAGYITFEDGDATIISVIGFNEVYQQLLEDGFKEGDFKIASLPGLCVLKLIAWSDKPTAREKDIIDFSIIVKNYFEIEHNEIFELHQDLFTDNFDTTISGARVLGRHIKRITERNEKLNTRIIKILTENVQDLENSPMGEIMSKYINEPVDKAIVLIEEVIKGITE
jgi:predicted nucleotidyltransferase